MSKFLLLFLFAVLSLGAEVPEKKEFVVIIPSFNNEKYCIDNIKSVAMQCYPYWEAIVIDDCSTDQTRQRLESFVKEHGLQKKVRIIHNKKNIGAMANFFYWINSVDEKKIIVHLDGDDRLAHPMVLEKLAYAYADPTVWMTYGNFRSEPDTYLFRSQPLPKKVMRKNSFRKKPWVTSHLRTYYAKLFHKIKKKHLMYKDDFVPMAADQASMFCLLEMSSDGHIRYMNEDLYIYNYSNPLNDEKKNLWLVQDVERELRKKRPYRPLKKLF